MTDEFKASHVRWNDFNAAEGDELLELKLHRTKGSWQFLI